MHHSRRVLVLICESRKGTSWKDANHAHSHALWMRHDGAPKLFRAGLALVLRGGKLSFSLYELIVRVDQVATLQYLSCKTLFQKSQKETESFAKSCRRSEQESEPEIS